MPDREAQEVQARDQPDDVHIVTLGRPGRGVPWCPLPADWLTADGPVGGRARHGAPAARAVGFYSASPSSEVRILHPVRTAADAQAGAGMLPNRMVQNRS
jgi:hypothetical protein